MRRLISIAISIGLSLLCETSFAGSPLSAGRASDPVDALCR